MSRTLSTAARQSVNASSTGEVWLALVELTHGDWAGPLRLVADMTDIVSNGDTYQAFPFVIDLPDEEAGQTAVVNWTAYNANRELTDALRSTVGPISGKVFWVLASSPDTVEIGPMELEMRAFEYDAMTLKGSLTIEPVLEAVFGNLRMDNTNAPGLF